MAKYEELIGKFYHKPVDGKFQDATASILKDVGVDRDEDDDVEI